ncbi:MAG: hypothetical protein HOH43_14220 [Candidatus Latescibacteria bacterium]|nr:hypothetical protein [Candidatus Latescibacterota bacterium]
MQQRLISESEQCIAYHSAGELTEEHLRELLSSVKSGGPMRDLLYLQASGSSVTSQVVGVSLVQNGEVVSDLPEPEGWPYGTVLEAIRDGWRVISFPNQALMLDESRALGLGCEFVLEKWSSA